MIPTTTGTGTAGTGTALPGSGSGSPLLTHGTPVTIDTWARTADGSPLRELETVGTVTGFRTGTGTGTVIYTVSTLAGTVVDIEFPYVHPVPVPATWSLELLGDDGWVPVPAGPGNHLAGLTEIEPDMDMLYAFALVAAGRARIPGRWVRASITLADGTYASHLERPAEQSSVRELVVTLVSGRRLALTFDTEGARRAAIGALGRLEQVVHIAGAGDAA